MPKKQDVPSFAKEVDLCNRFLELIGDGWTAYNEWAGWDILLVRKSDGFQIGIEAKLRMGTDVVNQVLEGYGASSATRPGPDCRAVLVPYNASVGFELIAKYIGFTIIRVYPPGRLHWQTSYEPKLPDGRYDYPSDSAWPEWAPTRRHDLPAYVPDVEAGKPAPVQLTDWKIRAIKIAIVLEHRGFLMRSDFKHLQIDHRRWLPAGMGWLRLADGIYERSAYFPDFKAQHPKVYAEILADWERWRPADHDAARPVVPKQLSLK